VKELFKMASDSAGKDMEKLLFEGSEGDLKATENTQIAITLVSLSVRACLQDEGIISSCAAGVSLGEYSAMVDTGILSAEDAFGLVVKRGDIMARAGNHVVETMGEAGMGAVMGLNFEQVSEVVAAAGRNDVFAANNNSPVQVVISGTKEGVAAVQGALKEAGAKRVIPLKVSGPFHTPLLASGKEELAEALSGISFKDPSKEFYSNVTGSIVNTGAEVKELCIAQMVSPVQWLVIEKNIGSAGTDVVVEAGPGTVLTGLWKKSGMEQDVFACGTLDGINKLLGK
jgi:[acyl-carrier-protein] S-malonyltransferase